MLVSTAPIYRYIQMLISLIVKLKYQRTYSHFADVPSPLRMHSVFNILKMAPFPVFNNQTRSVTSQLNLQL